MLNSCTVSYLVENFSEKKPRTFGRACGINVIASGQAPYPLHSHVTEMPSHYDYKDYLTLRSETIKNYHSTICSSVINPLRLQRQKVPNLGSYQQS